MSAGPRARGDERGFVLVAAVGAAALASIVALTVAVRVTADVRAAEAAVARERALHAAEAVLLATVERLERDAAGWAGPSGPDPSPLGHGWRGLDAALAGVPGAAGDDEAEVRLEVARVAHGPTFRVRVEARVRGRVRALEAAVRASTVADLAFTSVLEVRDPDVTGGDEGSCAVPRWAVGLHDASSRGPVEPEAAAEDAPCRRVRWDGWVAVTGPVHTDDALRFEAGHVPAGPITSAAPPDEGLMRPVAVGPGDATAIAPPSELRHANPTSLPHDPLAALAGATVCRLRGPTLVRLDGHTVRVRSPRSHPDHDAAGGPDVDCPGLDRAALDGVVVLGPPAPDAIVVLRDTGARCAAHPLGIDPAEDDVREQRCGDGTAYVWGRYLGARTVIAEDDVQLVWDVTPGTAAVAQGAAAPGALLGLVAGGSVVLRRPVGPPVRVVAPLGIEVPFAGPDIPPFGAWPDDAPNPDPRRWEQPEVVAVVAALGGSFRVQNPRWGRTAAHPIRITGAVAQRFRGATGWERRDTTGALQAVTGAVLEVRHDPRLATAVPPALPLVWQGRLRILAVAEVPPVADDPASG